MARPRRPTGATAFALARRHALPAIARDDGAAVRAAPGDWLLEVAWDGLRVLVVRVGDDVRIEGDHQRDWTAAFAGVVAAVKRLPARTLVLDGHVCALDADGRPDFAALRAGVATRGGPSPALIVGDLQHLDGVDLRPLDLAARRARLATLLAAGDGAVTASGALDGALDAVLASVRGLGLPGVVARPRGGAGAGLAIGDGLAAAPRSLSPGPTLTNRDKLLYPRDAITKGEVAAYYRAIAPVLLPYLRDRPVVCQRWPDGIDDFTWYQHRVPPRAPDYLRAVMIEDIRRLVIEGEDALLWMVNQAALTYHGFPSRVATRGAPDWVVLDLDPGEATTWDDTIEVALAVRRLLELLELPSVVKTSGQRGLHVLVPLAPGHTTAAAAELARGAARMIARLLPAKVTLELDLVRRGGRLFLDHAQHDAKLLVLPYSLRAVDGAPASTPLRWDEVTPRLAPRGFGLRTLRARIDALGDLAAPLLTETAQLAPALARLAAT